jgi:hypothetical protein
MKFMQYLCVFCRYPHGRHFSESYPSQLLMNRRYIQMLLCLLLHIFSGSAQTISGNANPRKRNMFSIELIPAVLPKASITLEGAGYGLNSHLQSSYDLGFNGIRPLKNNFSLIYGVHFVLGKFNFFKNIPASDFPPSYQINSDYLIEFKDIWFNLRLPVLIEREFNAGKHNSFCLQAGLSLRYSGMMIGDYSYGEIRSGFNSSYITIMQMDYTMHNKYKPWVTCLAGVTKSFVLDNKNIIKAGLLSDISTASFFKGDYAIAIPGKPSSPGKYKVSGTSLGLSIQYVFTGYNKRKVKMLMQNIQ